jgi:hypothetical protein
VGGGGIEVRGVEGGKGCVEGFAVAGTDVREEETERQKGWHSAEAAHLIGRDVSASREREILSQKWPNYCKKTTQSFDGKLT